VSLTVVAVLALAVACGALLQGSIGVGFALVVSPVMAVAAPSLLPGSVLILMLPLNAFVAWRERRWIDMTGTAWITFGRLGGAFAGLAVLTALPAGGLRVFIGFATILTVGASLMGGEFALTRPVFLGAGLITGITETATGVGGPPMALVYQYQEGSVLRATLAACFLIGEVVSLILLAVTGHLQSAQVETALWLLPALAIGALITRWFYGRLNGAPLRIAMLAFAMISGIACLL
jgi:uncharacterized membrane protein YfcA